LRPPPLPSPADAPGRRSGPSTAVCRSLRGRRSCRSSGAGVSRPVHLTGDVHGAPGMADGHRFRAAGVAHDPHLGTGGGAVGDGEEAVGPAGSLAAPRDEHPRPSGADRHRRGIVIPIEGAVVAGHPQLGAGRRSPGYCPGGCPCGPHGPGRRARRAHPGYGQHTRRRAGRHCGEHPRDVRVHRSLLTDDWPRYGITRRSRASGHA
jgi:hypothetical protein